MTTTSTLRWVWYGDDHDISTAISFSSCGKRNRRGRRKKKTLAVSSWVADNSALLLWYQ
jgi:hypothetical protein